MSRKRRKPVSRKVINSQLSKLLSGEILASDNFYRAMTHRSMGGKHNERMEFLGDSILGLVITSQLYTQLPNASEGYLSRLRASLVNEDSLADLAIILSISEHIHLGSGELKSGGFRRKSILADAFEAVVGCIYLEQGIGQATQFILTVYEKRLDNLPPENALKDPKSRLQELLQSKGYNVPTYALLFITGEAHKQTFTAECCVKPLNFCTKGIASSRRKAEQKAAASAIVKVKNLAT